MKRAIEALNYPREAVTAPTWEDVERAAMFCPVLHAAVTRVRVGQLTREQALIVAVLFLSNERAESLKRDAERLMREPARFGEGYWPPS